ncbi:MAG TPA: hypothetical protein VKA97_11165, partial [Pyrinomonadaceae bacterium]|nr:hypothetical protein [Pyrinomonadaceae bacterium]
ASPLVYAVRAIRPEGPKYVQYYAPSGLGEFDSCTRGDALRACPWLSILRAFGAAFPRAFGVHYPIRLLRQSRDSSNYSRGAVRAK